MPERKHFFSFDVIPNELIADDIEASKSHNDNDNGIGNDDDNDNDNGIANNNDNDKGRPQLKKNVFFRALPE